MKRIFSSKSAFFNPRIFGAFVLVTFGASLGVFSLAGPRPARKSQGPNALSKPTVISSTFNGVSAPVRDLPAAEPAARTFETELPPIRPNRPVPGNFVDSIVQSAMGTLAAPSPLITFEGQSATDSGCGCIPPDPNGAVGPSQYVQMVNSVFSVYSKNGTRLSGPTQINELFQSLPETSRCHIDNSGDPVAIYDQLADRWVLTQFAVGGGNGPTSSECVAVSKSGDATGEYYIYDFDLSNTNGQLFEDYPHLGVWPDAYYMSTHEFTFLNQTPAGAYQGSAAWAMERDKMLLGQPARIVYFRLGAGDSASAQTFFGGQLPSNLDGFTLPPAGSPNYFVEVDAATDNNPDAPGSLLRIWKFHVDWSNPANSTFGDSSRNPNSRMAVADFARPNCMNDATGCVPQAGDSFQLDPIGDRLMYRNAYRNFGDHEALVLNHTVVANATTGQMGPRWYEVRNPGGTPTIFQQSTFGPSGPTDLLYRWMSSLAMDGAGNMAIGYNTSSNTTFPSIAYAGRLVTDPINTLGQGETQMFAGGGPQHGELFAPQFGRWGDYTSMQIDPLDDCTFWYTTEYYAAADAPTGIWHTRIGSFKFPTCTPRQVGLLGGVVTDSASGNPIKGATVTAGGYTAITATNGTYQFSPLAPGTYTVTASAQGYFSASAAGVTITNGGNTTQNFALALNPAQPTPTPAPTPLPLETVNPPVLNDPGTTVTTNSFPITWSPAEVTAGLDHYVIEESTDYVNPLFDNADGTNPPGQAGSSWNTSYSELPNQWTQSPAYHNSLPNSYFVGGATDGFDTSLTLKNNITIPSTKGSGRLTFYSRYFNDPEDTGNVEISTNGGSSWNKLKVISVSPAFPPGTPPVDTRMQAYELDLTAYRGTPFKLQFRFNTDPTTYFFIRTVGWWLDDINVDGATWHQIGTVGPNTTSFNVLNKATGHYFYRVRGVYANGGKTANSNVQDIIVNLPTQFLSAKSRKTHSFAGPFDVDLPLSGAPGIEPRTGGMGGNFTIVYNFQNPITSCGSVSGATGTATVGTDGKSCVAAVSGLPNSQYTAVTLQGVTDGTGSFNVSAVIGVLTGDTNADKFTDAVDVTQTKSQSGNAVTSSNFREDVNVDGFIDAVDVSLVKSKSGTALP